MNSRRLQNILYLLLRIFFRPQKATVYVVQPKICRYCFCTLYVLSLIHICISVPVSHLVQKKQCNIMMTMLSDNINFHQTLMKHSRHYFLLKANTFANLELSDASKKWIMHFTLIWINLCWRDVLELFEITNAC